MTLVPRTQCIAKSAVTRDFNALWRFAAEPGSISLSLERLMGPRFAEQRYTLHRVQDTRRQTILKIASASTACAMKPTVKARVRNTGTPSV